MLDDFLTLIRHSNIFLLFWCPIDGFCCYLLVLSGTPPLCFSLCSVAPVCAPNKGSESLEKAQYMLSSTQGSVENGRKLLETGKNSHSAFSILQFVAEKRELPTEKTRLSPIIACASYEHLILDPLSRVQSRLELE